MRTAAIPIVASLLAVALIPAGAIEEHPRHLEAVPYSVVRITDGFWAPRIERNQRVTIRAAFAEAEKAGNLANFRIAAGWEAGQPRGSHAYDSDVYKIIEGAAYSLRIRPAPALEAYIDRLIDAIAGAQQPDGYLNTYYTLRPPVLKWQMAPTEHELYCAGHLLEAGVAYEQATGKRALLDVARRLADNVDATFGPGRRYEVSGHQEIELALVRLSRATGERRYFDLAKFFLDERGFAHGSEHRVPTAEELVRQDTVDLKDRRSVWSTRRYRQDHLPVVRQEEAVGHAVRAEYMYAAMTDVAAETGDEDYRRAVRGLWEDVAGKKLYLTGGVGTAERGDEGFGTPYNLPNEKAYAETCATVANILWNHRMSLLEADARYADIVELALYNGFLSGVSLSGDHFFYENPLASRGGVQRDAWSDPACCPSNVARLMPQVGNFVYGRGADSIFVNLFVASVARIRWRNGAVRLTQTTRYPWDGRVRIVVDPTAAGEFDLNIRIPAWLGEGPVRTDLYRFEDAKARGRPGMTVTINGMPVAPPETGNGYARLRRAWKMGDVVQVDLPMPVRRVRAHASVEADRGRVALMRGPILYCLEAEDNQFDLPRFALPPNAAIGAAWRDSLLGGVMVLHGRGLAGGRTEVAFEAIPYYGWANRRPGAMTVWMNEKGPGVSSR